MTSYNEINGTIVRDFAKRTLENLRFVEKYHQHSDVPVVFEVTQLMNSLLGLLVFPKETYFDHILAVPLDQVPYLKSLHIRQDTYDEQCDNLNMLIRHMRNSLAHFRVAFGSEWGQLQRIELKDRGGNKRWTAEIDLVDLRQFVEWFIKGIISEELLDTSSENIA